MSIFQHVTVFYFSGTGNARRTSEWIIDTASKQNVTSQIVNIEKENFDFSTLPENTLIGIVSPTHGFNLPPIVLNFLFRIPRLHSTKAFIVNTRAGSTVGKYFLPGLSGVAQLFPALILWMKGVRTVAFRPVDLPSNWISIHPGYKNQVIEKIAYHWNQKVVDFTKSILSGKKIYVGLYSLPIDLLIAPIAILYYFIGRFAMAKTFYATDVCSHCGLCAKKCPVNAIEERKHLYWEFECESCMRCMSNCPERAIETAHGFTFLVWWIVFGLVPSGSLQLLKQIETPLLENSIVQLSIDIVSWGIGLVLIFWSYSIMNYLLRFKWFNRLMTYTSLTKLKFWRRYQFPSKLARTIRSTM